MSELKKPTKVLLQFALKCDTISIMKKDLDKIKKLYGEDFAKKFCRTYFSHLIDREDSSFLEFLIKTIYPSRFFYEDLIKHNKVNQFKNFIWGKFSVQKESVDVQATPEELMKKAGYTLKQCKNFEDILRYKKYYALNEEVCSFEKPDRINDRFVFWAIKDNVEQYKRKDYSQPNKDDDYAKSVLSIQFTKGLESTLSIINRYNNSDSMFTNDLDNIYPGLTESFKKFYGINLVSGEKVFSLPGYVTDEKGVYHKCNYLINNVSYCVDNVIITKNKAEQKDPTRYIVADYFIIDRKEKTVKMFEKAGIFDAFIYQFEDIKKIDSQFDGENKIVTIYCRNALPIEITLNKYGKIIKLINNNVEKIEDCFMQFSNAVEELTMDKVKDIGDNFLSSDKRLKKFDCSKLRSVGKDFLYSNNDMINIEFYKLRAIDSGFMCKNTKATKFIAPLLKKDKYGVYLNQNLYELKQDNLIVRMVQKLTTEILPTELYDTY